MEKTKCAIIGSREYTNKRKIQEFVFKLKEKYKGDVVIVSGGAKHGADKYAKRYALDFEFWAILHSKSNSKEAQNSNLSRLGLKNLTFSKKVQKIIKKVAEKIAKSF